jgi:hypothetical protein
LYAVLGYDVMNTSVKASRADLDYFRAYVPLDTENPLYLTDIEHGRPRNYLTSDRDKTRFPSPKRRGRLWSASIGYELLLSWGKVAGAGSLPRTSI